MLSQLHSLQVRSFADAADDTLGPDNGGDSGQPYLRESRSVWQLPGPFTFAVYEWILTLVSLLLTYPHLWRAYPRYFSGSTLLAY